MMALYFKEPSSLPMCGYPELKAMEVTPGGLLGRISLSFILDRLHLEEPPIKALALKTLTAEVSLAT